MEYASENQPSLMRHENACNCRETMGTGHIYLRHLGVFYLVHWAPVLSLLLGWVAQYPLGLLKQTFSAICSR